MDKQFNIETEYKFLVDKLPTYYDQKIEIVQIYFDKLKVKDLILKIFEFDDSEFDNITTSRVRTIKVDNQTRYLITLKTKGKISRIEYEREITKEQYDELIYNNMISIIMKNRYVIQKEVCFEFDEYLNLKSNLITCEVEIDDSDYDKVIIYLKNLIKKHFDIEAIDVTLDSRYKNSNLHKYF